MVPIFLDLFVLKLMSYYGPILPKEQITMLLLPIHFKIEISIITFSSRLSREVCDRCLFPRIFGLTTVKPPERNIRNGLESSDSLGGVGVICIC